MASLSITWHAVEDAKTCAVCRGLNGYTWVFETGKDVLGDGLIHPEFGLVWSLQQGSRAHGHESFNCRCSITHEFNMEDVRAKCQTLAESLRAMVQTE